MGILLLCSLFELWAQSAVDGKTLGIQAGKTLGIQAGKTPRYPGHRGHYGILQHDRRTIQE